MWTWCCRKLCPCCCCWCPWCCHGKEGDLAELLTSAENGDDNPELQYYTVRQVARLRVTTSQEDIDSSVDLPISHWTHLAQPRGNAREQLGVSPAVYWTPTIHKVQPEIDTSIESGSLSATNSFYSRSRWHQTLPTVRPSSGCHGVAPCGDHAARAGGDIGRKDSPPVTVSAPNLAGDSPRPRRGRCHNPSPSRSTPRLRHSGTLGDVSLVDVEDGQAHWLKSQSMQDVNSVGDGRPPPRQDERALAYGIDTSLYTTAPPECSALHKSREALHVWRSAGEGDALKELSYGEVHFGIDYLHMSKKLVVHVSRVQNLPPKGVCFKYGIALKVVVLPNERQAKVARARSGVSPLGELSADFTDEFHFVLKEPAGRVLRISAFDADFMGRYDAIGHALFYLEDVPTGGRATHAMRLYRQSQPDQYPGSLEVALQYDSSQDKLTVNVSRARDLALSPQATHNWRSIDNLSTYVKVAYFCVVTWRMFSHVSDNLSTYVKVAYFCAGKKIKSSRSPSVTNTRNPVYGHTSEFILASNYPHEIYLVIQVLLPGLIRKDPPVGRLIFGPFYYADDRTETPWGRAMRTNEVVSHWYNMYL